MGNLGSLLKIGRIWKDLGGLGKLNSFKKNKQENVLGGWNKSRKKLWEAGKKSGGGSGRSCEGLEGLGTRDSEILLWEVFWVWEAAWSPRLRRSWRVLGGFVSVWGPRTRTEWLGDRPELSNPRKRKTSRKRVLGGWNRSRKKFWEAGKKALRESGRSCEGLGGLGGFLRVWEGLGGSLQAH